MWSSSVLMFPAFTIMKENFQRKEIKLFSFIEEKIQFISFSSFLLNLLQRVRIFCICVWTKSTNTRHHLVSINHSFPVSVSLHKFPSYIGLRNLLELERCPSVFSIPSIFLSHDENIAVVCEFVTFCTLAFCAVLLPGAFGIVKLVTNSETID